MRADEIREIIKQEYYNSYSFTDAVGAAATRIEKAFEEEKARAVADALSAQRKKEGSQSPAYYPARACDCGGERAKSKHANWCGLFGGKR